MGGATFLVGCLPTYEAIGVAAPILLIVLRLLQGLALGGEYGGAVVYVAEHAPADRRGRYTAWIQTTATLGLFLSLLVILTTRLLLGDEFETWGWRIPFLLSAVLLAISVYIRLQLNESPVFQAMKEEGRLSRAPLRDAFGQWPNLRLVLLALLGATAGQAVVWYGGQFYALFFLEKILQVASREANLVMAAALLIGTPFFIVFGILSDRVGRKPIVLGGCLLAALTYFPAFEALTRYANPALAAAQSAAPVTVVADPADCSVQFDPVGRTVFNRSCDVAKAALAKAGVPYRNEPAPAGAVAEVRVGAGDSALRIESFRGEQLSRADFTTRSAAFTSELRSALDEAGYPARADMDRVNYPMLIAVCTFPPQIRYTSMSLPYHIGNGWFGGFLPVTSFAIVAATGDIYAGLWYPIAIAGLTLVIGALLLPETRGRHITH